VCHFLDDAVLLASQHEDQRKLGGGECGDEKNHEAAGEAAWPQRIPSILNRQPTSRMQNALWISGLVAFSCAEPASTSAENAPQRRVFHGAFSTGAANM
jgi:hypothetical protein